jgi:two-component system sensor histidine kinase KdpD
MFTDSSSPGVESEPDAEQPAKPKRGRLKIFLGYAAGVGKTCAMLAAAQQQRAAGIDVVTACLEFHGCAETETLLAGLEVIQPRKIVHQGKVYAALDLDAILGRMPRIVLVDDLAHTNAPGGRHLKRYQDVWELLNAGIGVYTTLNIQHLESLNDTIRQITGVVIRETVPDHVLEDADEIEVVDVSVEKLLRRLEGGQVNLAEQAISDPELFFRRGNLSALREITLRRAADRVDAQMRAYMQNHAISGPWPAGERVLVCISPSPLSERLLRTGRRLADRLNAEWFAVYVETPGHARLSERERERIARRLRLAEALGARASSLAGRSVAETIVAFAQRHNVTKIVAGKPLRTRWVELIRGSIVDQIIRHSHDIDVYVISGEAEDERPDRQFPTSARPLQEHRYFQSGLLVAIATLLGLPLRSYIEPTNLVMLYLVAVVVAAIYLGKFPAVLASFLSVVAFDFIFVPPHYTFDVADAEYLLTFVALLAVGLVISALAAQAREQEKAARQRETQTAALYELSRHLAAAAELNQVADIVVTQVNETFAAQAAIFLPDGQELVLQASSVGFMATAIEQEAATWVFQHNQPAGRETDTLREARGYYLPLHTSRSVIGVMGVFFGETERHLAGEQRRLLESFASQAALALERAQLAEKASQAQLLRETEKLQTALLNSISHDLRTPLASVTGALSSLSEDAALLNEAARRELVNTAWEEAERLNQLVGNLLEMTRLESGALKVAAKWLSRSLTGESVSPLKNSTRYLTSFTGYLVRMAPAARDWACQSAKESPKPMAGEPGHAPGVGAGRSFPWLCRCQEQMSEQRRGRRRFADFDRRRRASHPPLSAHGAFGSRAHDF